MSKSNTCLIENNSFLQGFVNKLISESVEKSNTEETVSLYVSDQPMNISKIRLAVDRLSVDRQVIGDNVKT
jgi:hypothetical protein